MKLSIQCLITIILLNSNGCVNFSLVETFYTFTIVNESSEPIYFYEASLSASMQYPDTVLSESKPDAAIVRVNSRFLIDSRTKWSKILEDLPSDTLSIFIFDAEVYENTDWSEIRDDYNILKRYDLSLGELERLDFTVTYPPDVSMEGVKMYPSE